MNKFEDCPECGETFYKSTVFDSCDCGEEINIKRLFDSMKHSFEDDEEIKEAIKILEPHYPNIENLIYDMLTFITKSQIKYSLKKLSKYYLRFYPENSIN